MYQKLIKDSVNKLFSLEISVTLTRPEAAFGDYATNCAMQLAGRLKSNPREIAQKIVDDIGESDLIESAEVAGPGFINLTISQAALVDELSQPRTKQRDGQVVVAETNNPNPFKAMHIGHAYNSILADTIARLIEQDGATLHRVSYHGDVGLHVGKSMYAILRHIDGDIAVLQNLAPEERNKFMSSMYSAGSAAYKDDPSAKQEIDALAQESFAPTSDLYKAVYDLCKTWSFEQIDSVVNRLGNIPIEQRFLESVADEKGVEIVKQHTPDVFEESDGAYIFRGSGYGSFDNAFVASNGRGLYAARDLGLMELKNEQFHPEKSYIVTGEEQGPYFKGVIKAAELCDQKLEGQTVNIPTGLVKLSTGKMSSRSGEVIEIDWLFDQFASAIESRGGQPDDKIVAGAMRYQFLKVKIGSDVVFDINEAVSLTGNTGSYLQYAHARAKTMLAKSNQTFDIHSQPLEPLERLFVRKMSEFNDILTLTYKDLAPHHLCNYLYELAQEFNRFYEKNQVIGSDRESLRVAIVAIYANILKSGLMVLGIYAPDHM